MRYEFVFDHIKFGTIIMWIKVKFRVIDSQGLSANGIQNMSNVYAHFCLFITFRNILVILNGILSCFQYSCRIFL